MNTSNVTNSSDSIILQLKNLGLKLAQTGLTYALESVADYVLPKQTLAAMNADDTIVRRIKVEDLGYVDISMKFSESFKKNVLTDDPKVTYNTLIKDLRRQDDGDESEIIVKVTPENVNGGVSLINGFFTANW
ncbi:hypothetical protein SAMN02745134_00159 [Clostridium acidisoli DSM 12555]|jgi:hypothetical protein|uniref:Uncharacterized protein n=1 Tax=Clostridium acidisoli DSM 12555 TaxID=1121291 RepID=A0A1W1WZ33_9CLOT|nr:hypothetical protein [Clostridium acidisoli]SMC16810.1 hypothetical protein SAMN02745134_00159 [Clostridium acidisoli DSM 12555]